MLHLALQRSVARSLGWRVGGLVALHAPCQRLLSSTAAEPKSTAAKPPRQTDEQYRWAKLEARENMLREEMERRQRAGTWQRSPDMRSRILTQLFFVSVLCGTGYGIFLLGGVLWKFAGTMRAAMAEGQLMSLMEQEGADPTRMYSLYLHTQVAHAIEDDAELVEHMGELRFAPETMRITPVASTNDIAVVMNVYGTRRVGVVNALFTKTVDDTGLPLYVCTEFLVDSWDGRVWSVDCPPISGAQLLAEVKLKKQRHMEKMEKKSIKTQQ